MYGHLQPTKSQVFQVRLTILSKQLCSTAMPKAEVSPPYSTHVTPHDRLGNLYQTNPIFLIIDQNTYDRYTRAFSYSIANRKCSPAYKSNQQTYIVFPIWPNLSKPIINQTYRLECTGAIHRSNLN